MLSHELMHIFEFTLFGHENIKSRIHCLVESFSVQITKDLFYNGTFAITETVPDNGGLQGAESNIVFDGCLKRLHIKKLKITFSFKKLTQQIFLKHFGPMLNTEKYNAEQILSLALSELFCQSVLFSPTSEEILAGLEFCV